MTDVGGARMFRGDVLNKCSPECDVHDLDSAANAEGRDTTLQSRVEEIDFELITIGIDAVRGGVDVTIPVPPGIDVWASAQEKAVNDRHVLVYRIVLRWQDDWNAPRSLHCPHIWR